MEQERAPLKSLKESAKKMFKEFLSRSDEPGEFLSEEDKEKLREEGKINPETRERLEKNKNSKFRSNSLMLPLSSALRFLMSSEAENIPIAQKEELIKKINLATEHIFEAKKQSVFIDKNGKKIGEKPAFTEKEVKEVLEIIKEIEPCLK